MAASNTRVSHADLMGMGRAERDDLYRRLDAPGSIPVGDTQGTPVLLAGRRMGGVVRAIARLLLWQGKVFDPRRRSLQNKITPLAIRAIRARVYVGESWLDRGRETIVLDYSKTSFVARWIRDEIREVAPGLWLGKVYVRRWHVLDFTLRA